MVPEVKTFLPRGRLGHKHGTGDALLLRRYATLYTLGVMRNWEVAPLEKSNRESCESSRCSRRGLWKGATPRPQ